MLLQDKTELNASLWSSAEDNKVLRRELAVNAEADRQTQLRLGSVAAAAAHLKDLYLMTVEDLRVTNTRRLESSSLMQGQSKQILSELQSLRVALKNKEDECAIVSTNYKRREDSHQVSILN